LHRTISQKIIRNTIFNTIGRFWGILVSLFLTPYIVKHLGIERYGIWAVVGVLTGYFGLLDFGVGTSFVKYISEFYTKKEYKKINQVVNTGLVFYSAVAILAIALGFFFINPLLNLFKVPSNLYNEAVFVFFVGIILVSVSNALSPFGAIQDGLQRIDISSKVAMAISIPNIVGIIFFLESGYGLPGLMVNNAIILAISSIVSIIMAFKILPELKFNPALFSKKMFKKLFSFGYRLQIARVSSMVSVHIDKLLISYFLSIGLVTFYQLGSSIIEQTKSIMLLFLTALMPAFSEIDARGDRKKLVEGYIKGTKYLALISVPLFTFVIISAPQIMTVWMGGGYEKSVWIIQILGIGWLFAILSGVRSVVVQAIGKPEIEMKAGLVAAILNIPLSIIFIIYFGFMGVALGTAISLFFSAAYGFIRLHKEIHISSGPFIRDTILKTIGVCVITGLPFWGLVTIFQRGLFVSNKIIGLIVITIQAMLFFGIYLMVMFYSKPFDNTDIMILLRDKPLFIQCLAMKFCRDQQKIIVDK